MKLKYAILDYDPQLEDLIGPIESPSPDTPDSETAAECAEHYHSHQCGSDAEWPLTFVLFDERGVEEYGRFRVRREMEPGFYASPLTKEDDSDA